MEENEKKFIYTYSAGEQEEIKQIRQKYLRPEENKMEQLRKLDESATKKGYGSFTGFGNRQHTFSWHWHVLHNSMGGYYVYSRHWDWPSGHCRNRGLISPVPVYYKKTEGEAGA